MSFWFDIYTLLSKDMYLLSSRNTNVRQSAGKLVVGNISYPILRKVPKQRLDFKKLSLNYSLSVLYWAQLAKSDKAYINNCI